jgi:hypothetical protein
MGGSLCTLLMGTSKPALLLDCCLCCDRMVLVFRVLPTEPPPPFLFLSSSALTRVACLQVEYLLVHKMSRRDEPTCVEGMRARHLVHTRFTHPMSLTPLVYLDKELSWCGDDTTAAGIGGSMASAGVEAAHKRGGSTDSGNSRSNGSERNFDRGLSIFWALCIDSWPDWTCESERLRGAPAEVTTLSSPNRSDGGGMADGCNI